MLAAVPASKIHPPAPSSRLIDRNRLSALLDTDDAPVVLVCAPAGYGKTTLLSIWAARESDLGHPVAWVQLDADDNDPFRLWSAILQAIAVVAPDFDPLSPPDRAMGAFLTSFLNAIDERPAPICLVLDDTHTVYDAAALGDLNKLFDYLPDNLRVIMAGRADLSLAGIHRMRLSGRLTEIRTAQLAFRRDEAIALLGTHDVHLDDRDLDLVLTRTEGWAAGLRMAGITLARAEDLSAAVAAFVEDDQNAAEYLFALILDRQPDDVRRFVLATSICERFTVELAEAITGYDGGNMLRRMERANALISRTGPRRLWYRYHSLLRSYLYAELKRSEPVEPLHQRAAAWFEMNGDYPAAIRHAIAGGDVDHLVRLVANHGVRMVMSSNNGIVLRLLGDAPATMLARPEVALIEALAAVNAGNVLLAQSRLASIEPVIDDRCTPWLRYLYATVQLRMARLAGDADAALGAYTILHGANTGDANLDLLVLASRGAAAVWLDDWRSARPDLTRAHTLAVRTRNDHIALDLYSRLGAIRFLDGNLAVSGRMAFEAIEYAAARGWSDSPRCAYAYAQAAWSAYYRADHDAAAHCAARAMSVLDESVDPAAELSARTVNAAVRFEHADQYAALQDWRAAWIRLGRYAAQAAQVAYGAPIELRMALTLGEVEWAAEVIDRLSAVPGTDGDVQVLRAMLNARRGRGGTARRQLRPVLVGRTSVAAVTVHTDGWLLLALLAEADGEDEVAHQAITSAVALAAPQRLLRPFYDAGPALRGVLSRLAGRFGRHEDFVVDALAVIPLDGSRQTQPLTPRELQLLAELPSMSTVNQMAERLYVSSSTVKTHLRGIYRKLGVSNRREAVAAGRRQGLI
jgi:LuxR family maltose regulon positive regulatory protein